MPSLWPILNWATVLLDWSAHCSSISRLSRLACFHTLLATYLAASAIDPSLDCSLEFLLCLTNGVGDLDLDLVLVRCLLGEGFLGWGRLGPGWCVAWAGGGRSGGGGGGREVEDSPMSWSQMQSQPPPSLHSHSSQSIQHPHSLLGTGPFIDGILNVF